MCELQIDLEAKETENIYICLINSFRILSPASLDLVFGRFGLESDRHKLWPCNPCCFCFGANSVVELGRRS
ncbi:hypothetical protein [Okeania sp. SIO2B3]|uniref:hypothetical protein n=1 Tax=Okeania sp. SIO2B3 TaxID=2607784 RepID=UPI0013BF001A|nr:hypothetical protein [Okeania sp. SIO2B3]NET46090.1 hypothetical protein [Okeania sp. SIO2B3]